MWAYGSREQVALLHERLPDDCFNDPPHRFERTDQGEGNLPLKKNYRRWLIGTAQLRMNDLISRVPYENIV